MIFDCKLLLCCSEMLRVLVEAPPRTAEADWEDAVVGIAFAALPVWFSTCFLERWRPRFMCRSQYFWSATASLEHRHFFPSVRRHLPGSGSAFPEKPRWNGSHTTATTKERNAMKNQQQHSKITEVHTTVSGCSPLLSA